VQVRHLNCGTMRPVFRRNSNVKGSVPSPELLVCHCLLIETNQGLVMVDTGIGPSDFALSNGRQRVSVQVIRPVLDPAETVLSRLGALGYSHLDVRHVILTHLDLDHAGGLRDFPHAQIHVFDAELRAATEPTTFSERIRYKKSQWEHGPKWVSHEMKSGDQWFGFDAVRKLDKLPEQLLLVPLPGHTRGHIGVAVETGNSGHTKWLLHAGDAYFSRREVDAASPRCPRWLNLFETAVQFDRKVRRQNRERLAELIAEHSNDITVFCAHDRAEFDRLCAQEDVGTGRSA
jgi:glyoxylase-like metal-dependent hydrolase (beta-lactamase superfamily II)